MRYGTTTDSRLFSKPEARSLKETTTVGMLRMPVLRLRVGYTAIDTMSTGWYNSSAFIRANIAEIFAIAPAKVLLNGEVRR